MDAAVDFIPSKLGTKEHWDETYQLELTNFGNCGDIGEIWFGEPCQTKVVDWLDTCDSISKQDGVIELGCGNAALLVALTGDILSPLPHPTSCLRDHYRVCIDKGTFDAISLMADRSARQTYRDRVSSLLMPDGYFLLTSVNWTVDELNSLFCEEFELEFEIPAPKYRFGNKTGSAVTSLIFRKKVET